MGKYRVSMGMRASDTERLASVLKKYDIWCDLKKNGSLWVSDAYYNNCYKIQDAFRDLLVAVNLWKEGYPTFDHPWYLLKNDKSYAITYSPYPSREVTANWNLIISRSNDFGLSVVRVQRDEWLYSPGCETYIISFI